MYMTDALHSQVFTPHTIPYHIPSSRSERARQGGFCFLSIVTVARRRNWSSDLPDVCVAFSGGLVMGEQTTIFVLTSVVRLTISLLDKWILEKHGGTRLPTLPQQETIQINTCKKEGELGSSCDCALPRTKVRCPFRHGPPMNAKRLHCPTGVTVLTGPVRQAFGVTFCKCS
jgi:hypothetical protein